MSSPVGRPTRSSRSTRGMVVVGVVVVLALVVTSVLLWRRADRLEESEALEQAETEATTVASDIAVSMTSYDHRSLEEDFAWVDEDGTDDFEETFSTSTRALRGIIEKSRATAEGTVTDAAGTAEDPDHVRVIMFVDQRTVTRVGTTPRRSGESSRVVMQMVREDGRWLVDDVELR